jgi:hypothetical protein
LLEHACIEAKQGHVGSRLKVWDRRPKAAF